MSPDDSINLERLASSFEKIATALTGYVSLERDRFKKDFPDDRPKRTAEINTRDGEKREQLGDKATDGWFEETEAALPPSRFQERFDEQQKSKKTSGSKKVV